METRSYELPPEEVVFSLPPFERPATHSGPDAATVIGQGRALTALALGLGVKAKGYNVFVMGQPGTGRRTAILKALRDYTSRPSDLQDWVFVNNFQRPHEPRALALPKGKGGEFKTAVHELVEDVKRIVAVHADSEAFKTKKDALVSESEEKENATLTAFEAEAGASGFRIVQVSEGNETSADLSPLIDGAPMDFAELQKKVVSGEYPEADWNALREKYFGLVDRMRSVFEEIKDRRAALQRRIAEIRAEMVGPLLETRTDELCGRFAGERTGAWLHALGADMVQHLVLFDRAKSESDRGPRRRRSAPLSRYGVNVVVDNATTEDAPVVFENRPTLSNLFGCIDQENGEDGRTSYLRVRAGSVLRAAGGFLVLRAEDLLEEEDAWSYLKRVLQTGELEIQQGAGGIAQGPLVKPEAMAVNLKVILIGGELSYDVLYDADPDFRKLFKVCAEFDASMPLAQDSLREYAAFLDKIVRDEGLLPLTADGLSAAMERAVRLAEHRDRLSTKFSLAADLLREADWWARRDGGSQLDTGSIRRAVEARAFIHRLPEDYLESMMVSGEILIELDGAAVGKVNGLAVHDRGYYAFGLPVVVSARVAPGDGGVVNIEGESGLSGEILDKSVLILSGYLRSRYARDFPLSVTASVCFEQSYTEIDGDSATAAQLCAILSAISGIPLRQDLALTGSINQFGALQPVGGVSEKVEGFYSICAKRGLSGSQGVVIPRRNVRQLLLTDEVEDAVRSGTFHIYAVDDIDQVLEILTGRRAGVEDDAGCFPEGSFNRKASQELKRMAEVVHSYET